MVVVGRRVGEVGRRVGEVGVVVGRWGWEKVGCGLVGVGLVKVRALVHYWLCWHEWI